MEEVHLYIYRHVHVLLVHVTLLLPKDQSHDCQIYDHDDCSQLHLTSRPVQCHLYTDQLDIGNSRIGPCNRPSLWVFVCGHLWSSTHLYPRHVICADRIRMHWPQKYLVRGIHGCEILSGVFGFTGGHLRVKYHQ